MSFSPELYVNALHFAARAHGTQEMLPGLPYVVHITSVTMELIRALEAEPGHDDNLAVQCALLHDVVEDTTTPLGEIERHFGPHVAAGVSALTKAKGPDKAASMTDSLRRIRAQPLEIGMVKLADRITNLAPPPPDWPADKVATYRRTAEEILAALEDRSPFLSARLRDRLATYRHAASR